MRKKGLTLPESFRCAMRGIKETIAEERNMRIHISVAAVVFYFAYHLQMSAAEWCFLVFAVGIVLAGEVFNTAVEQTIDAKFDEYREAARKAKDAAAGSELIFAITAAAIGLLIFVRDGRIGQMIRLCAESKLRCAALVIYAVIAIWFIFPSKKTKEKRNEK